MRGPHRVLLAEDDGFLRKAASVALRRQGYEVITAADGHEALEAARRDRPDIILLDLIMPRLQGFDVLRALKADPETADIPVIVLTNLSQERDRDELLARGAVAYLVKSDISLEEVGRIVARTLEATCPRTRS